MYKRVLRGRVARAGTYAWVCLVTSAGVGTLRVEASVRESTEAAISQWDFNGPSAGSVPGGHLSPTPSAGAGTAALIGGTTAAENFGSGTSNGGSSDPVNSTPPNFGWQTTTYATQGAESGERGVQFSVSTLDYVPGTPIFVYWDQRHSNTSSRFAQFQYSIDGVNFSSANLPDDGVFEAALGGDRWYNQRTVDLSIIPGVADNPDFAFRIVAVFDPSSGTAYAPSTTTSTYAATGTWRFDMVTVSTKPPTPPPPPTDPLPDWPEIFNPYKLVHLNLTMAPADWQTVQQDETLSIYVPAMFWAEGDGIGPILVGVRRKSADPLNNAPGFSKVSLKIDINRFVAGQNWHALRKLSLENGDDENVVSEGLSWRYHHEASGPKGYDYAHSAAYASWVTLKINNVQTGIYLSVEQRDKRFLQNRGLWIDDETWLYEVDDVTNHTGGVIEAGPESGGHSPLVQELCYAPFRNPPGCSQPPAATLVETLPEKIDMQAMLTLAGVGAFTVGGDLMLPKGKNFRFADFGPGGAATLRMYYPWDLDATIKNPNTTIYPTGSPYATLLLGIPEFREQYSRILNDLVCGPIRAEVMIQFLNDVEPVISAALDADPNRNFSGSAANRFNELRNWVTQRTNLVMSTLEGWQDCPILPVVGDIDGDGDVDEDDRVLFVGVLLGTNTDPDHVARSDLNDDGVADGSDIGLFVEALFP